MPQKLVTIYLTNEAYAQGFFNASPGAAIHGHVEEHLRDELSSGWRIVNVAGFGGHNDVGMIRGWFAVVLEKDA